MVIDHAIKKAKKEFPNYRKRNRNDQKAIEYLVTEISLDFCLNEQDEDQLQKELEAWVNVKS